MFRLHLESFYIAMTLSFFYDLYIARLLHRRYDRQFGVSFVLSGLVAFSLPCFFVVGVPVYFILAAQAHPALTLILLTPLFVAYIVGGIWLRHKVLNKIFSKTEPSHSSPE